MAFGHFVTSSHAFEIFMRNASCSCNISFRRSNVIKLRSNNFPMSTLNSKKIRLVGCDSVTPMQWVCGMSGIRSITIAPSQFCITFTLAIQFISIWHFHSNCSHWTHTHTLATGKSSECQRPSAQFCTANCNIVVEHTHNNSNNNEFTKTKNEEKSIRKMDGRYSFLQQSIYKHNHDKCVPRRSKHIII